MLEQLQNLEDKIAIVAGRMTKMRGENAALRNENSTLRQAAAGRQEIEQRAQQLGRRVAELEAMLNRYHATEQQLTDRLRSILSKLATVEDEVNDLATSHDNR